ncbi:MAG TPA: hypothetical protein VGL86_03355 [Polyangia bacterium]|jgi:hypothetical protein
MVGARSIIVAAAVCVLGSSACTRLNPDAVLDGGAGGGADLALPSTACDPSLLKSDPRHCGGCDNDCTALPNVDGAHVACDDGVCNLGGACLPGFGDCTPAPGCETNLGTPDHCGSCTLACGGGDPLCAVDGSGQHQCASSCGAAAFCNGQCVDTSNDPANCGGCSVGCATPAHGEPACANGMCGFTCDAGYVKTPNGCVGTGGGGSGGGGGGGSGGGGGGTPQCGMTGASCASTSDCCSGVCLLVTCL